MNFPTQGFPGQFPQGQYPQAPAPQGWGQPPQGGGFPPAGGGFPPPGQWPQGGGYPAPHGGGYDPNAQLAAEIAGASVTNRGLYLEPGFYEVRVEKSFVHDGQQGRNFIVEASILRAAPQDPAYASKYVPGVKVSWSCNLTKHASAKGNVKGFIAAMLGVPASDKHRMDSELTPMVVSQAMVSNPFAGQVATVQVTHTPTKTMKLNPRTNQMEPGVYSLHTWQSAGVKVPEGQAPTHAPQAAPQGAPAPGQGFPSMGTMVPPAGQFGAPQGWGAAPAAPPAPAPFPPAPWVVHPSSPAHVWNQSTNEVITADELRARGL